MNSKANSTMATRWPSLMDLGTAAEYVSLSPRTLEEIVAEPSSPLRYVKLPKGVDGRTIKKRLLARADLDLWVDEGRRLAALSEDGKLEEAIQWISKH